MNEIVTTFSNNIDLPLVSILIPNFNHGHYLENSIESALNQTYPNKEVLLLDNGSSDDSLKIARKYLDRGLKINRNQMNVMSHSYKILASVLKSEEGKYFMLLPADDYIREDFVEKAVRIMEKYPSVGYVHGEKDFITESGELIQTDPFYNCSFVAPGRNTMPIYMVTTVAHPAQALVRTEAFRMIGGYDMEVEHMNADRSLWFYLSYFYDAAYIRKKMSNIRIGEQTETIITQKNMQHPILCHLTIKDYVKFAKAHDLIPVYEREREALKRLAEEFVGYCAGMIYVGDFETAKIYLDYAKLVDREIDRSDRYQRLQKMFSGNVDFAYIKEISQNHYQHKRSYEPPKGYIEIEIEEET